MTTTHWRDAVTGDFAKAVKWDDGKPRANTDAIIDATGSDYVVKVISADIAHSITLDSADATLWERAHGSLNAETLDIEAGTAILTQANTIGSISMSRGELDFSGAAALGDATISLGIHAKLFATDDAKIANDVTLTSLQAAIEVGNGTTLELDGMLTFNTHAQVQQDTELDLVNTSATNDGSAVVTMDGTISAIKYDTDLLISGVTFKSSIANSDVFRTLLGDMAVVQIANHGVLQLTHQDNIAVGLMGSGLIVNSGSHENLTLRFGDYEHGFTGTIKGDFDITLDDEAALQGKVVLKAGDAIQVAGQYDDVSIANAHFTGATPAIDMEGTYEYLYILNTVFDGGPPLVDMGTGQSNAVEIDRTFTGIIRNFGGHDGGMDRIVLYHPEVSDAATLQYQPNGEGTGGELTVTFASDPALKLNLEGTYTQSDFSGYQDSVWYEIDCSAEQSPPHVPAHVVDALI